MAGNDEQITNLLRELYPQSFKEKTYEDYFMVVKDAYEAFVEKYRTLLPDKTPTVFERLIKDTLGNQAKEMLQGKSGTVLPTVVTEPTPPVEVKPAAPKPPVEEKPVGEGTKERGPKQKVVSDQKNEGDSNLEEWKAGWFEDRVYDFSKWEYIDENSIGSINNLDDLRDVAIQRMRQMYMSNEAQEESFRTKFFENINVRAETLGRNAPEKVEYLQKMVIAMRELHVYWLLHWMGEANQGIGVNVASIATGAAKFGDSPQRYMNFLLEQQAIADAWHSQTILVGLRASHELSGKSEKQSLWNVAGYRLRRMTGQAIYDGIDYLKKEDLEEIIKMIKSTQDKTGVEREEVEQKLANKIFKMEMKNKPHTLDYQTFLNHSIPWYLTVRYREKFKQRVDYLYQQAETIRAEFQSAGVAAPPGLMTRGDYEKLGTELEEKFDQWNLGEIGAYSMWKRPDTSATWITNLERIALVAEIYHDGKINYDKLAKLEEEDKDMVTFQEELSKAKNNNERKEAEYKIKERRDYHKDIRRIFTSLKDRPDDLKDFVEKGLNFGMKMISLYDAKQDSRARQEEINKINLRLREKLGFDIFDWTAENLTGEILGQDGKPRIDREKKLKILQAFLDPALTRLSKQHEIIRNNLIRTVRVDDKIRGTMKEKIHAAGEYVEAKSAKIKSYVDVPIYQEFIDLDELYVPGKREGEMGESWMRYFEKNGFSHNAFTIYESYATKTREAMHKIFDRTTSISDITKLKEELEGAKAYKHLVDTSLAIVSESSEFKEYDHTTTWRIERSLDAIEEYVSSMMVLSMAMYRKLGVRHELAVYVNQQVQGGVNEGFFTHHHFDPAKSSRERAQHVEVNYAKYIELQRMHDDFKLRHMFNLCGFEGDKQKEIWQFGYLKNLNDDKEKGELDVSYDSLLLMAGLKEREMPKNTEDVRGYKIDEDVAGIWFDFYSHFRGREPQMALFEAIRPGSKKLLVERARQFPEFQGKDEEFIAKSLEHQFQRLTRQLNNSYYGLFAGIPSYQRTLKFVYERVIDAYVSNTFDKDRRVAFPEEGRDEWKKRAWGPEVNFARREQWKCWLIRKRKFAIENEDAPGFNKFIVTQVGKGGALIEPRDQNNWKKLTDEKGNPVLDENGNPKWECLYKHGTDEIESWLLGSGELDLGKGRRLTRLPNYFDKTGLMHLYMAIFSPEVAKEMFIHSGNKDWEKGLGGMIDYKGHHILKGPWLMVLTPKKMADILDTLIDPGTYSVFDSKEIRELKKKYGCTDTQVGRFERERQELGIVDLERGPNQALEAQEKEGAEALDAPIKFILEAPTSLVGPEIGAMFPGKKSLTKTNTPKKLLIFGINLLKFLPPTLAVGSLGPIGYIPALFIAATFFMTWGKSVSIDDLDPSWEAKGVLGLDLGEKYRRWVITRKTPNWKWLGFLKDRYLVNSIYGEKVKHRSSYELIEGKKPLWDDISISIKDAVGDVAKQKKELTDEIDTAKSPGGGHG